MTLNQTPQLFDHDLKDFRHVTDDDISRLVAMLSEMVCAHSPDMDVAYANSQMVAGMLWSNVHRTMTLFNEAKFVN